MDLITILFILFILYLLFLLFGQNNKETFDSFKSRRERVDELNALRGTLGNFYVNCPPCGRKRIIQERLQRQSDELNKYMLEIDREKCACKNKYNQTMSYFNDKYTDKDQIFCYNCLMDNADSERYFIKNYVYWPDIDDPVNGPPTTPAY